MNGNAAKAGVVYFAVVFTTGFVLGTIRVLWVLPRLGTRTAELIESPIMLAMMVVAARWVVHRWKIPAAVSLRLTMGLLALGLLLLTEFTFVLWIRGLTLREYWASRDPVSGAVYLLSLGLFAIMPLLAGTGEDS